MNKDEIIMILGTIKVAYPRFYSNFSQEDIRKTIDLWEEMFKNDNKQDISKALKELIGELEFPPSIADIKKKIKKYTDDRELLQTIRENENKKNLEKTEIKLLNRPKKETQKVNAKKYIENIKNIMLGGN